MASALSNGSILQQGRYRIEQVLGEGGFGITYQATDMRLGRAVAIKELFILGCSRDDSAVRPPLTYTEQAWDKSIQNFLLEARILAGLDHPGIVTVYDQFEENNTAYMVMKFIVGTTLSRLMVQQGGRLTEEQAREYTVQVGQALQVVHDHNLLHRDIKPSNIILQPNGQTVLIDFGAAREFALDRSVAVTAIASSGFSPPEQFYAKGRKGPYTDVFSLAATCYYLLTGVAPTHELEQPPATSLLPALNHALAFNPQDRPQTVADFLDELTGHKPAPPLDAVNSVIQTGSGDALTDSYARGMYETLTPSSAPPAGQAGVPQPTRISQPPFATPATNPPPISTPPPPSSAPPPPGIAGTMPPTPVYLPLAAQTAVAPPAAHPHHNFIPAIIGGAGAIILLLLLAVAILGQGQKSDSEKAAQAQLSATLTAFAGFSYAPSPSAPPSNTLPPSNTPLLVAQLTPTTVLIVAVGAAIVQPSDTPTLPPPSDTPVPATNTPLPPPPTPRPRPSNTPRPPTHTPVPPTSTPLPPPNPTTNPSTALGTGWSQLGPADFTIYYCGLKQTGSVARLTRRPAAANALNWACYTGDTKKVSGVVMGDACRAHYGLDTGANAKNLNDANSWACYRGSTELGPVPIDEYCATTQLYGSAKLEDRTDVPPADRWACFAPLQLGPVDVNAACANQYGPGALGYWLTLDDPRWSCWRRQ